MQQKDPSAASTRIIIVDSETDFSGWAATHLKAPDVTIETFERAEDALAAYMKQRADLVLTEARLPQMSGIELLKRLRQQDPNAMVLLFSGLAGTSAVIESMRLGAYDFLRKEQMPYDLRSIVESALRTVEARRTTLASASPVSAESIQETIIGRSGAMQEVFKLIGRVSRSDAAVMITGESGCGKELVARAIHKFSPRTQKEFVAINVTAIPDNLLESELFGHEKGAFTGAVAQRMGRFEQCDGGTLFLDEIGDMPLTVQSKLLRVLQEGELSRVGGNTTLKTDVRVLAATNKDLEKEVTEGKFREDLFYRLNVVRIHIPPLRERREDVRILAEFFLQRMAARKRTPQMRFSEDALALLEAYDWPGNVRELENTLQRACALCNADVLLPADIPLGSNTQRVVTPIHTLTRMQDALQTLIHGAQQLPGFELMPWVERELKKAALRASGQNSEDAAGLLGVSEEDLSQAKTETKPVPVPVAAGAGAKAADPKAAKTRKAS
ncbi:two-component system nitrogen regulation response regulator GlnG/two-component system response regulator AtoC [Roseimicrobium gellanilyticum]|uniref:DNA-binding transcriptional regulator NtrC n=1 Tax=Roseimicrobium gellanilyticum TaxID=748857 RepID=A0A366HNJ1_9BACT|nr:sigma-54 dependent transcriptional regulator [Roseimicrobium gellanilyticum]RBP43801.1 two-component system nitrogen regulation response regulator GlnG/two-component system response regulator AtoC [Roseimicrobium gellanilyticum]